MPARSTGHRGKQKAIENELQKALRAARRAKRNLVVNFEDESTKTFKANQCSLGHLGLLIVGRKQILIYAYAAIRSAEISSARRKSNRLKMAS